MKATAAASIPPFVGVIVIAGGDVYPDPASVISIRTIDVSAPELASPRCATAVAPV